MENLISKPVKKEHAEDCDLRNLGDCTCGEPIRNQAIDECIAYTNKLLEPLEWLLERYPPDEMIKGERSYTIMTEIQSLIRKHRRKK